MFRLIKIELTKILYGKSLWLSIVCALVIIVGFGILLNMDDVFDNPGEKQTALEEKYENSSDWKEQLRVQMELNQSMSDIYSQQEINMKNEILQYEINENLEPYKHNTAWDFIAYTFQILNIVLIIIAIWLTTEIIMSEYVNKTYKLVYTKMYERWKIYVSKYIASIVIIVFIAVMMMVMACVVGGVIFGFDGISSKTAICLYGKMMTVSLGGKAMLYMFFSIVKAIAVSAISFLIAELSKNQVVTVIVAIVCSLWGKMLFKNLVEHGITVGKYSLFMHYDFVNFIDTPVVKNETVIISGVVIAAHIALFLVAGIWLNKREDL